MGRKGQAAWNKGLKGYMAGHPCYTKGKMPWNKGLTKETDSREAAAAQRMREAHQQRRLESEDVSGVGGRHDWIRYRNGRPSICDNCGTISAKVYDWANLNHKYDADDELSWARLCRKCHTQYDLGKIRINGLFLVERGGTPKNNTDNLVSARFGDSNIAKQPEVRAKISKSLTGKKMSDAHRESLREYWCSLKTRMSGDSNPAKRPDVRRKISAAKRSVNGETWGKTQQV